MKENDPSARSRGINALKGFSDSTSNSKHDELRIRVNIHIYAHLTTTTHINFTSVISPTPLFVKWSSDRLQVVFSSVGVFVIVFVGLIKSPPHHYDQFVVQK